MSCKLCNLGYGCDLCDGDGYVRANVNRIGRIKVECPECDGGHKACVNRIKLLIGSYRLKMNNRPVSASFTGDIHDL